MIKKGLLSSVLVACVIITSVLCFNSCKKTNSTPTELTIIRGESDFALCMHCRDTLWDFNYWSPIVGATSDSVFHVHEYPIDSMCATRKYQGFCRYYPHHHKHEVRYYVDPSNQEHHYHDQWIHLGGGGSGE